MPSWAQQSPQRLSAMVASCGAWLRRPVPVPFSGTNLVSLSHVEDLATMMAAAVGKREAIWQAFNLTSDTPLSHAGIAMAIGKIAGKEVKVRSWIRAVLLREAAASACTLCAPMVFYRSHLRRLLRAALSHLPAMVGRALRSICGRACQGRGVPLPHRTLCRLC